MTRRRPAVLGLFACWPCLVSSLVGQTTGAIEGGASYVDYDGFLPSAAFYLVPSVQYESPGLSVGGRGSWVVFESGNSVLQGTAAGGGLVSVGGPLRAELSGSAGFSIYTAADQYGHLLFRGRLHAVGRRAGAWLGGVTGRSFLGGFSDTPVELSLGGWTVQRALTLGASATRTWFGEAEYLDAGGSLNVVLSGIEMYLRGGFRTWTSNVDDGVYGEAVLHVPVSGRLSAELSGGHYLSDPVRGVLAATYASFGLRMSTGARRRVTAADLEEALVRAYGEEPEGVRAVAARLAVERESGDAVRLQIHAAGADRVEVMGDFTDWVPLLLDRVESEWFEITLPIPLGVHRLNVRLDGGEWLVPRGMRAERDEFGGMVGVLVIS